MRQNMPLALSSLALVAGLGLMLPPLAAAQTRLPPGAQQGRVHNPFSSGYIDMNPHRPNRPVLGPRPCPPNFCLPRPCPPWIGNPGWGGVGGYVPPFGNGFAGSFFGGYGVPAPIWGPNNFTSFNNFNTFLPYGSAGVGPYSIYGPLVLPTGSVYGVNALPPMAQPRFFTPVAARPVNIVLPQQQQPVQVPANAAAMERAGKHIAMGDRRFAEGEYLLAYQDYLNARQAAPQWSEVAIRRGWALLALKRYQQAAESFRSGIEADPTWPQQAFKLLDFMGENKVARSGLLEQTAQAAQEAPMNRDLMYSLGVLLYFDGQAERSQTFFRQALAMGEPRENVGPFLSQIGQPQPVARPAVADEIRAVLKPQGGREF